MLRYTLCSVYLHITLLRLHRRASDSQLITSCTQSSHNWYVAIRSSSMLWLLFYTTTVFLCVALDFAKSNAYDGVTDISLEAVGISFDLRMIHIGTGKSTELIDTGFRKCGAGTMDSESGTERRSQMH
ncbi:hypothetical protein DAEQUDRAFT_255369 [Daedalea quercina L-15889]|uniref:Uncharacterized protein n=1 Tax=Daedalea quercina L-15889 TaxID=1314783 RepID=A0A165QIH6_9APHY|nr:hypothetical protein DAEQUDRAFT_255369 [Daedalea quercina L-15889]